MIRQYLRNMAGKPLETLELKRSFEIQAVSDRHVVIWVSGTGKTRTFPIKEIESAYQALAVSRVITRSEIQRKYSPRNPAYIAAILAALPNVDYALKPITLMLR